MGLTGRTAPCCARGHRKRNPWGGQSGSPTSQPKVVRGAARSDRASGSPGSGPRQSDRGVGSRTHRLPTPSPAEELRKTGCTREVDRSDISLHHRHSSVPVAPLPLARKPPDKAPGAGSRRFRLPAPASFGPHREGRRHSGDPLVAQGGHRNEQWQAHAATGRAVSRSAPTSSRAAGQGWLPLARPSEGQLSGEVVLPWRPAWEVGTADFPRRGDASRPWWLLCRPQGSHQSKPWSRKSAASTFHSPRPRPHQKYAGIRWPLCDKGHRIPAITVCPRPQEVGLVDFLLHLLLDLAGKRRVVSGCPSLGPSEGQPDDEPRAGSQDHRSPAPRW
ncbi:hypothetical protein SAMN05216371_3165 [Streptomyces sp. TLI_053]|nr:hypothetical protein SAMN05216371_3165 [Streptomyces sp. TLI_053]